LANIKKQRADQVDVPPDRVFDGFDGYQKVIDSGVDIVLLCAAPHFRPKHLRACVEAGKHVFAEKPVAVDAPGVRSVLETTELARKKNLFLVSGLCWRYETNTLAMMDRLHSGAIGEITSLHTNRYGGGVWVRPREEDATEMQYQMSNWYYFTWLSGDFITEQFVHELDRMAWVMQDEYPVACVATGGRQTRTGPDYGHIYDHFAAEFEYANGVKLSANCRHQRGCSNWLPSKSQEAKDAATCRNSRLRDPILGKRKGAEPICINSSMTPCMPPWKTAPSSTTVTIWQKAP
jgi:predicted dehydrogenase